SYGGYQAPRISSAAAASDAIETFDKSGDQSLDEDEIAACPAIHASFAKYDSNGDSSISSDELIARFDSLFVDGATFTNLECVVLQGGRPVSGARVKFTPEAFVGEGIFQAEGVTDRTGRATVSVADQNVPEDFIDRNVIQVAIYRVEIESGNSTSVFGHEVDLASRDGMNPKFDLTNAGR
ncbi:MAG: hypothetical protein ACR2NU_06550, partial [Aeoliella sp.]